MIKRMLSTMVCVMLLACMMPAWAASTDETEDEPIYAVQTDAPDKADEEDIEDKADDEDKKEDKSKDKSSEDIPVFAQVTTPKGKLNMRKSAKEKSTLVASIPNHAYVRVLENDGEWTHILYKGKTGFVKAEFITVYDDKNFTSMEKDASSADVLALKKRLKSLGYYNKSVKMNKKFDDATVDAVSRFQEFNRLEPTGIVDGQLYAFIMWGDAPEYGSDGGSTDPLSGLSCKISASVSNHNKKDNGNITMSCKYTTKISGGTEPYKIKVKLIESGMSEAGAPLVSGNPFTFEWYNGSTAESFKLLLIVTDAEGVTVTSVTSCSMNIPYSLYADGGDTESSTDTEGGSGTEEDFYGEW